MVFVHLTEDQRAELRRVSHQAVGRVALRAHMVLLSDRGYPVLRIAEIHGCGEDVVRTWLHRYVEAGVAGLEDRPGGGRPPKHALARAVVDTQASQSPRNAGHVQSCWTVGLLAAFLAMRFGLALSCSTVRRCLHRMGWRWRRPRLTPASVLPGKHDPEEAPKLAALRAALVAAAAGAATLLFLDECDLHLLPVIRAMWMKGERVRVPTPGQNRRRAFFGALDASSGRWHSADHDRKLAAHFVRFLQTLADAYPSGPLYLVLDNAPTHTAKLVQRWLAPRPHVRVLWLPKYVAHEHNPVERIWGLMQEKVAANRLAGDLDELVTIAHRFFAELAPHPVPLPKPPPLASAA
jgi:transposase